MEKVDAAAALSWEVIEQQLPPDWRELADEHKLVRRNLQPHLGTKVTDIAQILRLVLYQVGSNAGLLAATAAFAASGMLSISAIALHKWMRKLGPYLAALVARCVETDHQRFAPERWAGYSIVLVDASSVVCPGAKGTTARVHKAMRLTDLRIRQVFVTDVTGGETLRRFDPAAGELWICDRGYANPPAIAWAVEHNADVLVRVNRGSLPLYDAQGRSIDVVQKASKLAKPGRARAWQAFVHVEGGQRIQGRLCATRIPADKAEQARTRLRREQGPSVTEASLAMADFVCLFTTIPRDRLLGEQVLALYGLRWQLELEFKRNKSLTGLDRLPNFRPDTIESWLYAKLLLHQLLRRVSTDSADFSPSDIARVALVVDPRTAPRCPDCAA